MASIWVRANVCALFAALALTGCGDDGGDGGMSGAGAGVGGMTGGAGGMTGGAAGVAGMMTGGMGGMMATGGAGAGGMTGGAGAGGMTGGMGGMTGDVRPGCEAAVPGTPAELHAAAQMSLKLSCGSSGSCHSADEGMPRADLAFAADSNLNMILVDKPACQVPTLMVVKSGGGQAALDGSYLWQKMVAPVNANMEIIGKPEWGTAMTGCDQLAGSGFGVRMPFTGIDISDTRLAPIRNWICAGAAAP